MIAPARPNPFRVVLVLLALAVTPVVLTAWIGAPVPRTWPTAEQVEEVLRGLTAAHFLALLRILVWAAWLAVLVGTIWEIVDYLAHRDRDRVAARRPWFLRLTGALTLGTTATTAMTGATATAAVADVDTPAEAADGERLPTAAASPRTETAGSRTAQREDSTIHTVRVGDTLWDISEAQLGDGDEWATIYRHNKGKPQPDGGRLTDADLIRPGWKLTIPQVTDEPTDDELADDGSKPDTEPQHPEPGGDVGEKDADDLPSPNEAETDPTHVQENPGDDTVWTDPVVLGVAGVAAAGLVAGLVRIVTTARRRVTAYERRTGRTGSGPAVTLDPNLGEAAVDPDDVDTNGPPALAVDDDGNPVTITAIASGGVGLTGPGAEAVVRAAIATCLASGPDVHDSPHAMVLTTRDVLDTLCRTESVAILPSYRLHAADDNAALLRRLSREIVTRHREIDRVDESVPLIVVAECDGEAARELTSLLNQAADWHVYGIILGDRPHHTMHIDTDGTAHTDLHGTLRCHHLDAATFCGILTTLAEAEETLDEPVTPPSTESEPIEEAELLPHTTGSAIGDEAVSPAPVTNPPQSAPQPASPPSQPDPAAPADEPTSIANTNRPPLHLRLLGEADLRHDDAPVLIRRARGRELLARLALAPQGVGLDELLEVVCGDIVSTRARHHFQSILTQTRTDLRQHTGEPTSTMFILYAKQRYRLDPEWFSSDIDDFTSHLTTAATTTDPTVRATHLQSAIDLYGEFAAGLDSDGTWTLPVRAKFADDAATACLQLAEHHTGTSDSITVLERATAIAPYQEDAYVLLIRAHLDNGDPEAATKVYNRLKTRLSKINRTPSAAVRDILKEHDSKR